MSRAIQADRLVMRVAAPRGGVCTRAELLERGLGASTVDDRVRHGMLRPIRRGVYVVDELANEATLRHAATLAIPASIISHLTAGEMLGFALPNRAPGRPVDVIVPNGTSLRLPGVVLHRQRRPPGGDDVVIIDGLPVTAPARTIVDLSAVVGRARLQHIVQTQIVDGNPPVDTLVACFHAVARRGVTGIGALRGALGALLDDQPVLRSKLEQATADLLATAGIEGFIAQYRPPWYDGRQGVVDFAHPGLRIVLEADGRRWHRRDQEMANDRRRDRLAAAHGWGTVRVTWPEVTCRPGSTAADLAAVMTARAA
ncbi:MAG: DUF559 domain-containing protein [Acidimicrobiia bacterium]|nr:DUF559 domain-containing protein [Acidimicrobiia bacterium]